MSKKNQTIRMATCCPDKKHHCKDLCEPCYHKMMYKKRYKNPEYRKRQAAKTKQWALDNPERVYLLDANKHLIKNYNMTLKDYNVMLDKQKGLCKLCNRPEKVRATKRIRKLAVDHCHATGKIRGLLCFRCNTSISQIESIPNYLKTLKIYLGDNK